MENSIEIKNEQDFTKYAELGNRNGLFYIRKFDGFYPAKNKYGYFIRLNYSENNDGTAQDARIAKLINVEYDEYINLLKNYNSLIVATDGEYYFEKIEDCINFINDIVNPNYLLTKFSNNK